MSVLAKMAALVSVTTLVNRVGQYAGPVGTVHLDVPVNIAAKMAAVGHVEGSTAEDAAKIAEHLAELDQGNVSAVDATAEPAQFTATAVAPPELINTPPVPITAPPEPEPIKAAPEPTTATTEATKVKADPKAKAANK